MMIRSALKALWNRFVTWLMDDVAEMDEEDDGDDDQGRRAW